VLVNGSTVATLIEYTRPAAPATHEGTTTAAAAAFPLAQSRKGREDENEALDDRLVVVTRDALGRRCWVLSCLDLVDPRQPRLAGDAMYARDAVDPKLLSEASGGAAGGSGAAVVLRAGHVVRGALGFPNPPPHRNPEPPVGGHDATAAAATATARPLPPSLPAGVPRVCSSEGAGFLPFVRDPLLLALHAHRHLLPRSRLLALEPDAAAAGEPQRLIAAATAASTALSPSPPSSPPPSSLLAADGTGRAAYPAASEDDEAALLAALLPLPVGGASDSSGAGAAASGAAVALPGSEEEQRRRQRRRRGDGTAAAAVARFVGMAAISPGPGKASFFPPAAPATRAHFGPGEAWRTDPGGNSGSAFRNTGDSVPGYSNASSDSALSVAVSVADHAAAAAEAAKEYGGGRRLQKSRLFLESLLGATSADATKRVELLDGSAEMVERLDALDALPERDTHVVWLMFARNRDPASSSGSNSAAGAVNAKSGGGGGGSGDGGTVSSSRTRAAAATPMFGANPLPPIEVVGRGAAWATQCDFTAPPSKARAEAADATQRSLPPDWHAFVAAVQGAAWPWAETGAGGAAAAEGAAAAAAAAAASGVGGGGVGGGGGGGGGGAPVFGVRCGGALACAVDPAVHGGFSGGVDLVAAQLWGQPLLWVWVTFHFTLYCATLTQHRARPSRLRKPPLRIISCATPSLHLAGNLP